MARNSAVACSGLRACDHPDALTPLICLLRACDHPDALDTPHLSPSPYNFSIHLNQIGHSEDGDCSSETSEHLTIACCRNPKEGQTVLCLCLFSVCICSELSEHKAACWLLHEVFRAGICSLQRMRLHFVPHREHKDSFLQRPYGRCVLCGKWRHVLLTFRVLCDLLGE